MLAPRQYLTAAELDILPAEHEALAWFIEEVEAGRIKRHGPAAHRFNMAISCVRGSVTAGDCGTVACIGGWMAMRMGLNVPAASAYVSAPILSKPFGSRGGYALLALFHPLAGLYAHDWWRTITAAQAARVAKEFMYGGATRIAPAWQEVYDEWALNHSD